MHFLPMNELLRDAQKNATLFLALTCLTWSLQAVGGGVEAGSGIVIAEQRFTLRGYRVHLWHDASGSRIDVPVALHLDHGTDPAS